MPQNSVKVATRSGYIYSMLEVIGRLERSHLSCSSAHRRTVGLHAPRKLDVHVGPARKDTSLAIFAHLIALAARRYTAAKVKRWLDDMERLTDGTSPRDTTSGADVGDRVAILTLSYAVAVRTNTPSTAIGIGERVDAVEATLTVVARTLGESLAAAHLALPRRDAGEAAVTS
jgi:hypothetical protein